MRKSALTRRAPEQVRTKYFPLKGGLNLTDAPLSLPPGVLLHAINYECVSQGGYRRIDGIERFDGQPSPADQSYWLLNYDVGTFDETVETPTAGATATGVTSGATGKVGFVVVTTGSWAGGDAAGYIILFNVVGTFDNNETITFLSPGDGLGSGFSSGFG